MRLPSTLPAQAWHSAIAGCALALLLALFAATLIWLADPHAPPLRGELADTTAELADDGVQSLALPGFGRRQGQADLRLALPPVREGASRRVVWVPRDPVERIWIEAPGWDATPLDFYQPRPSEGLMPAAFLFPVPDEASGEVAVRLHAEGAMPVALQVHVLGEDAAARWQQRAVALNTIVYSGCFMFALVAIALFWTVRESFFLLQFAACSVAGVLFAALNGHLYGFPLLGGYGTLDAQGLWALILLFTALVTALLLQLANGKGQAMAEAVRWLVIALCGLAGVLMLGFEWLVPLAEPLALLGCAASVLCSLWLLATAVRWRTGMAIPALLLFVLLLAAAIARFAVAHGVWADDAWTRYGYQLAAVCLLGVMAMALMGRIGVYRQQRDEERDARAASERRMQREADRASLARILQARLRELAPADIEWTAFRLLFEHLLPHVPVTSAAVVVHGYHGRDVVVTEPIDDRPLAESLGGTRLLMLRRQAQSGRVLQHAVDIGGKQRMEALVPVAVGPQGWGALLLQRQAGERFTEDELALAVDYVRLAVLHTGEAVVNQALRRTAERDALTGSHNRRSIDQWLARQFDRAQGAPLSVMYVDIDHFKPVNDLYGHACGDHCLRSVATALRTSLGPDDLLGRYGGEEFIVLLPGTDLTRARAVAEQLRVAVEDCEIEWQGSHRKLTVSIGVAARHPSDASAAALLERADSAMYEAKRAGRNQVSVSHARFGA